MAAGLRKMQENQGFSENRIDKFEFIALEHQYSLRVLYIFAFRRNNTGKHERRCLYGSGENWFFY